MRCFTAFSYHFFHALILLLVSIVLISCGHTPPAKSPLKSAKTAKSTKVQSQPITGDAYIQQLTQARLTLLPETTDLDRTESGLAVMDAYSAQKPAKPETPIVVILDYKGRN